MSAPDPLSEACAWMRDLISLVPHDAAEEARTILARLDALPAPVRWGPLAEGPVGAAHGWFYPDAHEDEWEYAPTDTRGLSMPGIPKREDGGDP